MPTRRDFLQLSAASALAGMASAQNRAGRSKPNILFLMDDQHRGDCLGVDGNRAVRTPVMDQLAAEGAYFRHAYSSTPSCTPARGGLLTGLSPWGHGQLGYGKVAEAYPFEKAKAMNAAGYHTYAIGKMHFAPQRNAHGYQGMLLDESGREQSIDFRSDYRSWFYTEAPNLDPDATGIGWNDYPAGEYKLPERLHPTRWIGDCAVRFLETYNRPEPFFLKVSFERPHSPYDPPARFMREFDDAPIPERVLGDWSDRYRERSSDRDDLWHGDLGAEQARHSRQGYYANIQFIDEQLGRILEALHKRGWYEETLIIFFSDHGDMLGDHHLWRKCYAYEPSARIPMILRWPGGLAAGERGQVRDEPVEIRDVLPTFLDAAGAEAPEHLDGRSLLDLARGRADDWRRHIDLEHSICYSPKNNWSALTDGRWKYIYHALDGEEQLFDLSSDPGEESSLAGESTHTKTLAEWRGKLVDLFEQQGRGEPFLRNGKLSPRPGGVQYSPNYPT
ncbi:MAG: arylsulfatase [Acidobacteria bacterium]|nr:arylsulfatase [Acidobacteriota bacterium]